MIGALSDQKVLRFGGEAWRVLGLFLRCFVFEKISEGILLLCEVALAKYIIMGGCQCQEQVGSYPAPTLRLAGKPPYLNKMATAEHSSKRADSFQPARSRRSNRMEHLSIEQLEAYSRNQTELRNLAPIEEHLLICEQCRATLDRVEEHARILRAALQDYKKSGVADPE